MPRSSESSDTISVTRTEEIKRLLQQQFPELRLMTEVRNKFVDMDDPRPGKEKSVPVYKEDIVTTYASGGRLVLEMHTARDLPLTLAAYDRPENKEPSFYMLIDRRTPLVIIEKTIRAALEWNE